jgi:hypothetical protein
MPSNIFISLLPILFGELYVQIAYIFGGRGRSIVV